MSNTSLPINVLYQINIKDKLGIKDYYPKFTYEHVNK
jgi:hypothetical protein